MVALFWLSTKVAEVDHYDAIVPWREHLDSVNSLNFNTKGVFLASNRSRQQRRPSSSGTEEENAA